MFLWFVTCGVLVVMFVFRSSGVDYRVVAAGSILPLAENLTGSPWVMHTLTGSVVLLLLVMLATAGKGRRLARRRWLGLPIATFIFLASSGAWHNTNLFWWPFTGISIGSGVPPEFERPIALLACLEVIGCVGLVLVGRKCDITNSDRLLELLKTGRLLYAGGGTESDRIASENRG